MGSARKLKITNNGEVDLYEASSNGTSKVVLKAPASLAGDLNVVLPSTAGSSGQFLKTDGAGNTSWDSGTSTLQSAYTAGNAITIASNPVSIDRATGGEALEVKATTSGNPYVSIEAGTSVNQVGTTASGAGWVGTTSNHNLEIKSNNVTRATVKNTGEFSIHNDAAVTGLEVQQDGIAAGMTLLQSTDANGATLTKTGAGAGNALEVHNDGTGAGILVHQDGAGKALDITQDGDSNALAITKTGTSTSAGISVTNSAVGSTGIAVTQNDNSIALNVQKAGTGVGSALNIHNDGTGYGLGITQDGASYAAYIVQNGASPSALISQTTNNTGLSVVKTGSGTGAAVSIDNDGTGYGLYIVQDGNGYPLYLYNNGTADTIHDSTGAYLGKDGQWHNSSISTSKENFRPEVGILEKVKSFQINRFNYICDHDKGIEYIGPTAEDFFAAFNVGRPGTIASTSPGFIGILAIQELLKKVEDLELRVEALESK